MPCILLVHCLNEYWRQSFPSDLYLYLAPPLKSVLLSFFKLTFICQLLIVQNNLNGVHFYSKPILSYSQKSKFLHLKVARPRGSRVKEAAAVGLIRFEVSTSPDAFIHFPGIRSHGRKVAPDLFSLFSRFLFPWRLNSYVSCVVWVNGLLGAGMGTRPWLEGPGVKKSLQ